MGKNAGFIILLTSIFALFFFGEIRNLTTFTRLMDCNNGFSLSFFFGLFLSFLWIGAQFPQEKFLSYARILTLDYYFLLMDFVSGVSGCVGGPNFFCDNHGLVGDEEELKKMLNDRPVAVTVDATPFQFYSSGILDCRSFHSLNHAVFAVGYNDGSDFIVRNSWGKSWGE